MVTSSKTSIISITQPYLSKYFKQNFMVDSSKKNRYPYSKMSKYIKILLQSHSIE